METATDLPDSPTAIDAVFEKLLVDIVGGAYPAGARLPAERELARQLGASRPTLREALRRLGEWNLVEPRRGSGIIVRPYRDWGIEVVPAYLRYGKPTADQPTIARILIDVLTLRRAVVLEVIALTAPRIPKGGTAAARNAMARAWSMRDQPAAYPREDFEIMRTFAEAAQFTPAVWMLNRLAEVWFDAAGALQFAVKPPAEYCATHLKFFELIEAGQIAEARELMSTYLERHDQVLVAAMQVLA